MAQYYPIVIQSGNSLAGDSLGFHAYSLRLDNCTNQWMLEETSMAYIPPYSLGMCLRLYGTGVAILLNSAPVGQPQLAPIVGEQVVGVYSDQLRTEVAASPIRQFTIVQSVSDLTQGPMPATPPVGVTRMWAASDGTIHYLLPNGQDATFLSSTNYASYVANSPLGGDLAGTVNNGLVILQNTHYVQALSPNGAQARVLGRANTPSTYLFTGTDGLLQFYSDFPSASLGTWNANTNNLGVNGSFAVSGATTIGGTLGVTGNVSLASALIVGPAAYSQAGDIGSARTSNPATGIIYLGNSGARYVYFDGTNYQMPNGVLECGQIVASGAVRAAANTGNMGQFASAVNWSSSTISTWIASPITVSFTVPTGHSGSVLLTWVTMISSAVVGTIFYTGGAVDGGLTYYQACHILVANEYQQVTGTLVVTGLAAGAHTATVYVQANAGVFSIWSAAHSVLNVTGLLS